MWFSHAYAGSSAVADHPYRTAMRFSPDTLRQPTHFRATLRQGVAFREAISALHDVVVSDLRFVPRDRAAYKAWAQRQEELALAELATRQADVTAKLAGVQREYNALMARHNDRMRDFDKARERYFNYIYHRDHAAWLVLDPVISVHPDQVFFECFSADESSYGKLTASHEVFEQLDEVACGTTNIDYSQPLYNEFQKIRSYKETTLEVDPSGFAVQTADEDRHREVKIELPDSWLRGFLQVSSAMSLPAARVELHPMDIHNLCFVLRRRRELVGPRSMRFCLSPGAPARVVFEPWGTEIICPRSRFEGDERCEVRLWGRRRLHVLERLIPVARGFTAYLLGSGLPSFWVADLGEMTFTLGLSGWTANDWSRAGNFDLMAPRAEVDELTKRRVFDALKESWFARPEALAEQLGLDRSIVLGALAVYTQAGRAIYDLQNEVYRLRELTREPLPLEQLRFANEREERAMRLLIEGKVRLRATALPEGGIRLAGVVPFRGRKLRPSLMIDADERLVGAECSCNWYQQHRLRRGPCEHMLVLRMAHVHPERNRFELQEATTAVDDSGGYAVGAAVVVVSGGLTGTRGTIIGRDPSGKRYRLRYLAWGELAEELVAGEQLMLATADRTSKKLDAAAKARQLAEALEDGLWQLIERGLIEVEPRYREAVLDELHRAVEGVLRSAGRWWRRLKGKIQNKKRQEQAQQKQLIEALIATLLESENVEEVYGDDADLANVLTEVFAQGERERRTEH